MIRVEVVLKRSGWNSPLSSSEDARVKQVITGAVLNECVHQNYEIVRIQFLGPPPRPKRKKQA